MPVVTSCVITAEPVNIPRQYRNDGKSRILPTIFLPDPSITLMWHSVCEVGRVGEIVAYMY